MSLEDLVLVVAIAGATAFIALVLIGRASQSAPSGTDQINDPDMSLLFRNDVLEHATPAARSILGQDGVGDHDWRSLHDTLKTRFPKFPVDFADLGLEPVTLKAADPEDGTMVRLQRENEMSRVEILSGGVGDPGDLHHMRSLQVEVAILRQATSTARHPIWQVSDEGAVVWHNPAYARIYWLAHQCEPLVQRPLFDPSLVARPGVHVRSSVQTHDHEETLWFDLSAVEVDGGLMFHAVDIGAVIQAEIAQRNFVQTLAKTFAQLSTGLAIFDRKGQLALFNPALVDLTGLPAEFLSARPDLLSFFDRLRDNRVMPEPKNYGSWRQEISDLIVAASDGRYRETWTLDSGQTYRIKGRPHPDGAVAFLIEDISAEVSLTRNFRAELELGQSMMDSFDDALAVFSSSGVLTFCNLAYRDMWKIDPDSSFADVTILDSIKAWQAQSQPDPSWGDIRDFVMKVGDRAAWETAIERADGQRIIAHVRPLASGASLIRFECTCGEVAAPAGATGTAAP